MPCVLFATKDTLGQFVSQKFNLWSKRTNKFATHNTKQYHQVALARMDALKSGMIHPESTIKVMFNLLVRVMLLETGTLLSIWLRHYCFVGSNALCSRPSR